MFGTLHTNNAIGAMPRLMDMEIEPFLLTASVNVVGAQRLVRKVCQDCKKAQPVPEALAAQLRAEVETVPDVYFDGITKGQIQIYKGEGCEKCENTGYKGRFGIFEVLPITTEIQELILSKAPNAKILDVAAKLGMISLRQDGIIKVLRGETTLEEVVRVTKE